ncbi:hypothetical protein EXIGLDRAFT_724644 [Exidia glandulosa HHB12029]|uniref:DUF803-domain-containing protein n=1 Tax=Exidia glandulosa HHB12029 TaxID=1314781 RepID=A0A165MRB4_EXIGL|nr:hypothetical protein EXIGLDRAFT_724644 [Exidia glandulosa HHB12029]
MVDDKYIGLALAVSSSAAIGTSFIITKKGLNDAAKRTASATASDGHGYLKNPIWWLGFSMLIIGEIANFAAYTFAPPILVTPLGALSVLVGAVLASLLLKEELGHIGRIGCTLCLLGSLIIVLHAPEDREITTVDEILHYAVQPGFLLYAFTVLVVCLVMIYRVAPTYGRSNPLVYISICSLVGSISVMCIKGFGVALKLTLNGNNQLTHPSTYVFGITTVVCIVVQMNYFNKALDTFSTNVVNPIYYVCFSTATIVASLILFQGFDTTDASNTISLITGFLTTFLGVHLLNHSRAPEPPRGEQAVPLGNGVLHPRLSLSLESPRVSSSAHGRRSSIYRVFDADEEGEEVGLRTLREEDEEDEDADERTRLARDPHRDIEAARASPRSR